MVKSLSQSICNRKGGVKCRPSFLRITLYCGEAVGLDSARNYSDEINPKPLKYRARPALTLSPLFVVLPRVRLGTLPVGRTCTLMHRAASNRARFGHDKATPCCNGRFVVEGFVDLALCCYAIDGMSIGNSHLQRKADMI
jgi:hypothetical protein